jgi:hypothetical protein
LPLNAAQAQTGSKPHDNFVATLNGSINEGLGVAKDLRTITACSLKSQAMLSCSVSTIKQARRSPF